MRRAGAAPPGGGRVRCRSVLTIFYGFATLSPPVGSAPLLRTHRSAQPRSLTRGTTMRSYTCCLPVNGAEP